MRVKRFVNILLIIPVALLVVGPAAGKVTPSAPGSTDLRIDPPINAIAWQGYNFENAAVAYSTLHDQFLVVFERDSGNGDIYGRFVNGSDGDLLGPYPFYIAGSSTWQEANPDVAYDPDADRFMVVYDEGSVGLRHVRGRLVYGKFQSRGDQLASNIVHGIAATGEDEFDPAVAYNAQDSQYMVVFNYSEHAVYARRLNSGTFRADFIGEAFEILTRGSTPVLTPDIAWSDAENNRFLVVFTDYDSANSRYITKGAYLFDTQQLGSQIDGGPCWVAPYNAGPNPITNSTTRPSTAYDPHQDAFFVLVEHEEAPGRKSIQGHALDPNNDSECFGIFKSDHAFPIEFLFDGQNTSHEAPDVTYSGIGGLMYVNYLTLDTTLPLPNDPSIYFRTIAVDGEDYHVGARLEVQAGTMEESVRNPAAAAARDGKAMVAWQREDAASGWEILGRFVLPYWEWLPVVLNE